MSYQSEVAFERWNSSIRQVCGEFETEVSSLHDEFIGDIDHQFAPAMHLAKIRTNAGRIARNGANHDTDDTDSCFLVMQNSGFARIRQDDRAIEVSPGEVFLMDSMGSCEILPYGVIEHASLHLPRAKVEKALDRRAPWLGKVSTETPSGLMISTMMQRISNMDGSSSMTRMEGEALEDAVISLIAPAIQLDEHVSPEQLYRSSRDLWEAALVMIHRMLDQPDLAPATLAERLNISVRQLYRVFEDHGDSVCRYIMRARLEQCAKELSSCSAQAEPITSIAYRWGFCDSAHFSRSFKKYYNLSPREYRAVNSQAA